MVELWGNAEDAGVTEFMGLGGRLDPWSNQVQSSLHPSHHSYLLVILALLGIHALYGGIIPHKQPTLSQEAARVCFQR